MNNYTCYGGVRLQGQRKEDAVLVLLKDSNIEAVPVSRIVFAMSSREGTGMEVLIELTADEAENVKLALQHALDAMRLLIDQRALSGRKVPDGKI